MASFADKLKAAREARGLSQYALAKRAGVTGQALSLLELGQREPSWATVQRLALALGLDCTAFADEALELPPEGPPPRMGRPPKAPAPEPTAPPEGAQPGPAGPDPDAVAERRRRAQALKEGDASALAAQIDRERRELREKRRAAKRKGKG